MSQNKVFNQRQETNRQILELLFLFNEKHADMRFTQMLANLDINHRVVSRAIEKVNHNTKTVTFSNDSTPWIEDNIHQESVDTLTNVMQAIQHLENLESNSNNEDL